MERIALDTNVLLAVLRGKSVSIPSSGLSPFDKHRFSVFLPAAVVAEVKAFPIRSGWGTVKLKRFNELIAKCVVIHTNPLIVEAYNFLMLYSQKKLPAKAFVGSGFKLSENDCWIAATAWAGGMKLLTTDGDFAPLQAFAYAPFSPELTLAVERVDVS